MALQNLMQTIDILEPVPRATMYDLGETTNGGLPNSSSCCRFK